MFWLLNLLLFWRRRRILRSLFMWVEFVVGSLPCFKRYFLPFTSSLKNNTSWFQFDLERFNTFQTSSLLISFYKNTIQRFIFSLCAFYLAFFKHEFHDLTSWCLYHNVMPSNISDLFTPTQDIHHYNIRFPFSCNFNQYYLFSAKSPWELFLHYRRKIWNSIPEALRKLPKHVI